MSAPKNSHESFANLDTAAVQAGRPPVTPDGPVNPPIVLSSTMHAVVLMATCATGMKLLTV
jgi:hypothetical protein